MPEAPAALFELETACGSVLREWAGALLIASNDAEADIRAMSDDGLVRATEALAGLGRRVEALQARCAAGIAERSRGVGDDDDLARKHGFASPERLIAQATGGRYTDAARLVAVGQATSRRASFTGEALPPRHPFVARALDAGTLGVAAADVIRRFLDHLPPTAARDELDAAEELLVDRAPAVGVDGLVRLIKQLEAHLDPDGVKPREDELRARRGLSIWQDAAGMINLKGAFDPANGAPIKLAIEALVGAELHRARDAKRAFGDRSETAVAAIDASVTNGAVPRAYDQAHDHADAGTHDRADGRAAADRGTGERIAIDGGADPVVHEQRTIAQMNADALADIARLSLSSAAAPPALRGATVVARIDVDALVSGRGHATIDGVDQPVSAATARELAESAGVAPFLMRNGSETLDLGRSARLFSPAQKIALVERDGGCAWPSCQRPPSHAQAHHIAWWGRHRGRTELSNGIMLCSFHHHRVHDDGWNILIREGRSWFVPPPHLDPEQRPRPGNVAPNLRLRRASVADPPDASAPPSSDLRTAFAVA